MSFASQRLGAGGIVFAAPRRVRGLLWWRGPAWGGIADAFAAVEWRWVAAAVGLNLLSVLFVRLPGAL